jgi:hypothetical protein
LHEVQTSVAGGCQLFPTRLPDVLQQAVLSFDLCLVIPCLQVLVTQTAGYTKATQDEPYGDILIRAGKRMAAQQAQAA